MVAWLNLKENQSVRPKSDILADSRGLTSKFGGSFAK